MANSESPVAQKPDLKLQGLQVLRGVAALLVMWCHLKYNLGGHPPSISSEPWLATDLGGIGVDIFFVISGFVITMSAANMGRSWRVFLANRIARVVPLYFSVSGFTLLLLTAGYTNLGVQAEGFKQIFNTFYFLPVFDGATFTNPLCVNGWTLCFEIWFYILFAGWMAWFGGRRTGKIVPWVILLGFAVVALFYDSERWFLPKFLFHPLALEFGAGCVLFQVRNSMGRAAVMALCLLLPVFLAFAIRTQFLGAHIEVVNHSTPGMQRAGIWGGFAFCLVGLITQADLKRSLRWPAWLLLMGDASYSIYLIAPLVMPVFRLGISSVLPNLNIPPVVNGSIYVVGTIVGGILLFKFFEVPATKWAKRILVNPQMATRTR